MPKLEDIYIYLEAVWRVMTGHPEALNELDTSADGFWQSFGAIIVALPPLLLGWVDLAARLSEGGDPAIMRLGITLKLAILDIIVWLLPLLLIGLLSRSIGIERRYSTYVVASNWGMALAAWILAPFSFFSLLLPDFRPVFATINLAIFLVTMLLLYRLIKTALQRPHSFAAPFYLTVFFASTTLTGILYSVLI